MTLQGTAIVLLGSSGITIAEAFRAHYEQQVPLLLIETHKSLYQAERGARVINAQPFNEKAKQLLEHVQNKQDANELSEHYYENIPDDIPGENGHLLFLTTAEMQFSNGDFEATLARAELYETEITNMIAPYSKLILIASLGGTTNTAIAPFIAQLAKRQGKMVETIATMPAQFEGKKRNSSVQKGLAQLLKKSFVTVIELEAEQESFQEYFKMKDQRIVEAIIASLEGK